eukprot:3480554-Pyramimonas_sp.AAC.1
MHQLVGAVRSRCCADSRRPWKLHRCGSEGLRSQYGPLCGAVRVVHLCVLQSMRPGALCVLPSARCAKQKDSAISVANDRNSICVAQSRRCN